MNAVDFVHSLYLGDRCCKTIAVDGRNATIRVTVDTISRIRHPSGSWDYYTAEDVVDGVIVFDDVTFFELKNGGAIPNDSINSIEAEWSAEQMEVRMSIDSVTADATHHETTLTVRCRGVHIEDPSRPEQRIVD
jgi:hypothetical protein